MAAAIGRAVVRFPRRSLAPRGHLRAGRARTFQQMRSAVLLAAMLGLLQACVRDDASHCGNRSGDQTCAELSPGAPYCNVCVAANDGCVEQPAAEPECRGETGDTGSPSVTSTGVSDASTGPETGSSSSSGSVDDTGTSDGGAGGTGQICGDGTVEGSEQCEPEVEITQDCMSEGLGMGDLTCMPTCLFDPSDCEVEPECSNNVQEPGEECDGTDTPMCTDFPSMYIAGEMACTKRCLLDDSDCVRCNNGLSGLLCRSDSECCAGRVCNGITCVQE